MCVIQRRCQDEWSWSFIYFFFLIILYPVYLFSTMGWCEICVCQCEANSQPMFSPVTLITQMRGWAGVEGLHGQALLYATLRKPLWALGPHFKWLFILALITQSNPTADTVVCVQKSL